MEKALGVSTSFANLAYGQQGDDAFDLIFYPGDDPEAAARSAYVTWSSILSRLPGDGRYSADLAMIEAENGYYILVRTTVTQAARPDQDEPEDPYTKTGENSYTINSPDGLGRLLDKIGKDTIATASIKLESDVTLPASWPDGDEAIEFSGILDGNGKTITIGGTRTQGLFAQITSGNSKSRSGETTGTVKNLHVLMTDNISSDNPTSSGVGAVVGYNWGIIDHCTVTVSDGSSISTTSGGVGAVAGSNDGTITSCVVTIHGTLKNTYNGGGTAGGVAGHNRGTVSNCTVTNGTVAGDSAKVQVGGVVGMNQSGTVSNCTTANVTITATVLDANVNVAYAGGVVGRNGSNSIVENCNATNVTVNATSTDSGLYAGGVVGYNSGKVQGTCTATNVNVTATTEANDRDAYAGGVVGRNSGTVDNTCTWSGNGTITATANGNTAIVTSATPGGTDTDGDAYAGTLIGYDRDGEGPVAYGGGEQQGSIMG